VGLSVVAVNLRVLFRVPRNNPASYNLQGQRTRKWETQNTRTPTVRVWTTKRSAGPKIGSSWTRLDARFKLSLRRASVVNFHGTSPVIERENKIAEEDRHRLRKVYANGRVRKGLPSSKCRQFDNHPVPIVWWVRQNIATCYVDKLCYLIIFV